MSRILPKQINSNAALTGGTIVKTAAGTNVWSNQSTDSLLLPKGTTAQEPSLNAGQIRYNTDKNALELCYYDTGDLAYKWDSPIMQDVAVDANMFTGFVNTTDSIISFDSSTRTFTIAPASTVYEIYYQGRRIAISSAQSVILPNTEGLYYIYFDSTGTLQFSTTFWTRDQLQVAAIYWEVTNSFAFPIGDHRRGMNMSSDTYTFLNSEFGPIVQNGLQLTGYTTSGTGNLDSDMEVSLTDGAYLDGDVYIPITNSPTPSAHFQQILNGPAQIPMLYFVGPGAIHKDTATIFPVKQGTARAQYNLYSGGSWSTVDASEGYYTCTYILASSSITEPIFGILSDEQFATLSEAQLGSNWDAYVKRNNVESVVQLIRPLYILIYQTSSTYTNTPHARLVSTVDVSLVSPTGRQIDLSTLSGLSEDVLLQYVNVSVPRTITAQHTFAPTIAEAPFLLGTNALDQLVVGLNADYLDGYHASYFQPHAVNLDALSSTATTGLYVITGSGTSDTVSITSAGTITVTNGNGLSAGNINIDLPNVGTPVSNSFVKITTDAQGRVSATTSVTSSDLISTLGYTPLNKAGDTMTGILNMGGNKITNLGAPTVASDATTKAYVDAIVTGLIWQPAIQLVNMISDAGGPPVSPVVGDSYIIGTGENTGAWSSFSVGDTVQYQPTGWTLIQASAIGNRFIIDSSSPTTPAGSFTSYTNYIVQITGGTPGAWVYSFEAPLNNYAATTNNANAYYYGDSYTYSSALSQWIAFAISTKVIAGGGLYFSPSSTLNIGTASSSRIVVNAGNIDLATTGVTPGTYTKLTVDAYGRITVGASLSSSDVTTALGYTPQAQNSNLTALAGAASTGIYVITGSGTSAERSIVVPTGMSITNADGVAGNPTIALTTNLLSIENISSTGLISYTGSNTFASRSIVVPTGMSITNADGVAGNPTIALTDNLLALESLSTTGFAVRTGTGTWATRTISGQAGQIVVSPIDGVSGNVTVSFANIANNTVLGNLSGVSAPPYALSTTGSGNVVLSTSPSITTPFIFGLTTISSNGDTFKLSNDSSVYREGNWAITPSGTLYTLLGDFAMNYWSHNVAIDTSGNFQGRDDAGPCQLWVFTETGLLKIYTAPTGAAGTLPVWTLVSSEDINTGNMTTIGSLASTGLILNGATSGAISILPQAVAGTYNFNLPTTAGSAGQVLTSQGGSSSAMIWTTPTSTLQLYKENPVTPLSNTVSGNNAVAIGEGQTASGQDSIVLGGASNTSSGTYSSSMGMGANSNLYGQVAHSNGNFATAGDAQASQYVLRNRTNGNVTSELFLDGSSARLVMQDNSAWIFKIYIIARRYDAVGDYGAWEISGIIKRDVGVASTALVGKPIITKLSTSNNQISINIVANSVQGALKISASNTDASKSYNWVARVDTTEVM